MGSREQKTTSKSNRRSRSKSSGFTLIEILIVLSIIVMIMSIGIPTIGRLTMQRVASTTRKFVGMMRSVRNDAILLNKVHRIAIDMQNQTWWVEAQTRLQLLDDPQQDQQKKKKDTKKQDEPPPSGFEPVKKYSQKPNSLPGGVAFDGVLKEAEGLLKEGTIYIHFFPSGYAEQSIIYLNKEGAKEGGYSLIMRPASGMVDIFNRHVTTFEPTP